MKGVVHFKSDTLAVKQKTAQISHVSVAVKDINSLCLNKGYCLQKKWDWKKDWLSF